MAKLTGGSTAGGSLILTQLNSPRGIEDEYLARIDSGSILSGEYAKFTANGLESKSYAEVRSDLDLEIGTDIVAYSHVTNHPAPTTRDSRNQIAGSYETADATILKQADVDDTPVNGVTTAPVSSNWAYDHAATHPAPTTRDSRNEAADATILKQADVDDTPVNGVTTAPVSSNWAYDHVATHPAPTTRDSRNQIAGSYEPADSTILKQADVDDTPVNGVTTAPVSSNWAYDHVAAHPAPTTRDARNQIAGSYLTSVAASNFVASAIVTEAEGLNSSDNDTSFPTTAAVKDYADALIGANDAMVFKGAIDCSADPNYPAASVGWVYKVSVTGNIGGASGPEVEENDQLLCIADNAGGTHATVGSSWSIIQANIDGAVIGPSSAGDGRFAIFDGTSGKLLKNGTGAPGTMAYETATNYVPKSLFNDYSMIMATSDNTPIVLSVGTSTLVGRASSGAIAALSASSVRTILNVAEGANAYSLPVASEILGGVKSGTDITVDGSGNVSVNNNSHTHTASQLTGTEIWTADTNGTVFSYDDSNPTHNGKYAGAVIYVKGDGTTDSSLLRAGMFTGDHISTVNGYYVGTILGTTSANTTQVINSSGEWIGVRDTRSQVAGSYETADATILKQADVDDTPVNGVTTAPVSSNWAYDHVATHPAPTTRDSRNQVAGSYDNYVSWTAKDHDGTTYPVTSGDTLWFKEGAGIDVNFTADDEITITNTITNNNQLTNGAGYTSYAEPGIFSGGGTPSLATGVTAEEIRSLIGAGTSSTTGTVTSVAMSVPTGLSISGSPITTSGTLALSLTAGYIIPTTTAFNAKIEAGDNIGTGSTNYMAGNTPIPQGTVTSVGGGTGITSSGGTTPSLSLDFSELTDMTADISGTTEFILQNSTTESRKAASEIKLSNFNNDSGWTANAGTVTSVTAGNGMTQSGTSTINPTLNVVSHAGAAGSIGTINVGADAIGVNLGTTSTTAAAGNHTHAYDNYGSWTAKDHDGTTYTLTSGDTLWIKEGTGIDVNFTADDELTITNTAPDVNHNTITNITVIENATTVSINSSDGSDDTIAGATASLAGVVTNTTQTFGGDKTIQGDLSISDGTNMATMQYNSTSHTLDFIFA